MRLGLRRKFASAHFAKIYSSFLVFFQKVYESRQIYVQARNHCLFLEIIERMRTNMEQTFFARIRVKIS